jgi:hypothetical protein
VEECLSTIVAANPTLADQELQELLRVRLSRNILAAFQNGQHDAALLKRAVLEEWGLAETHG